MQPFSPEALLPRGVPDLQLDPLAGLDLHQPGEEVHADGGVRHLGEATLREPPDQTRLSHRGVPDDDQPELIEPYRLHDFGFGCLSHAPVCRSVSLLGGDYYFIHRYRIFLIFDV